MHVNDILGNYLFGVLNGHDVDSCNIFIPGRGGGGGVFLK